MDRNYAQNYQTLIDPGKAFGDRFQAAIGVLNGIEKSKETATEAAKDLPGFIDILREGKENQLSVAVFDVLSKLSTLKDQRENFAKAGFPQFCAGLWKDEKLRLRSSFMVMSLLQESGMVQEMVEIGMVEVLLRYSDWVDRQVFPQKPAMVLRTRRFVFESLKVISQHKKHHDLLIMKEVVQKIKRNCFGLTFSMELSSLNLAQESIINVRRDELMLQTIGLEILFNLCGRYENYGRVRKVIRKEEVKYIYDYDSDEEPFDVDESGEENRKTQAKQATLKLSKSRKESDHKATKIVPKEDTDAVKVSGSKLLDESSIERKTSDAKQSKSISKMLMRHIHSNKVLDDILGAATQQSLEIALSGLRILYRLCGVLHLFVKQDERVKIINQILEVASRLSGQRRHNCFSCLIVLSRYVENCPAFVGTSVFRKLFFLGMEESGEVLNQLVKVLRNLSLHSSTALEQSLYSDIPKLLTKILHEDFKDEIPFEEGAKSTLDDIVQDSLNLETSPEQKETESPLVEDDLIKKKEKKEELVEKTAAVSMLTIYTLVLEFMEARKAMVKSGVVPVLIKILHKHLEDVIGMHVLMTLSCLSTIDKTWDHLLPVNSKSLILMVFEALDASLNEKEYSGFFYSPREITSCLKAMSEERSNARLLAAGLPLYIKILHTFVQEYGLKPEEKVSTRTVGNVAYILQNISKVKSVMARMIELGPQMSYLLDDAQAMTSEAEQDEVFAIDNETSLTLQYLHLALEDEIGLTKEREKKGDRIRMSSRINWAEIAEGEEQFKEFMGQKYLNEFV